MATSIYSVAFLLILHTALYSEASGAGPCPTGWLSYNKSCYKFSTKRANWFNSQTECNGYDASLLRIHSQDELTFITNSAQQTPAAGYWTDLNDNSKQKGYRRGTQTWRWGASELPDMKLVQWTQAPANDGQANCAGINNQGQLADVLCNAVNGYLCVIRSTRMVSGASCPSGWDTYGSSCYWKSNSSDPTQRKTWAQAQAACPTQSPGATLLIINDHYDAAYIQSELPKLAMTTKLHWVGLVYNNSAWRWWTNNVPAENMVKWAAPTASVGMSYACAAVTPLGKLVPMPCSTRQSFICGFSSASGCPLGWLPTDSNCYWVGNVSDTTQQLSFNDAKTWCANKAAGATLLVIDDPQDVQFLSDEQSYLGPTTFNYWIGLQFINPRWTWLSGAPSNGSLVTWTTPSPQASTQAPCAGLNTQGKLVSQACTTRNGAVCSARSDSGCPFGWLLRGPNCYWIINNTANFMTWSQARDWCTQNFSKATLFIIKDQYDVLFYQNELPYLSPGKIYWTGLTFQGTQWKWYMPSEIGRDLVKWETEPNNVAGLENCGLLRMTGTFNDRSCYWWAHFICQKPQYNYNPQYNIGCGPWIRAGQNCYNFHKGPGASWQDSRVYCQQQQGDLMKVDTFDKMVWLQQQMLDPANSQVFWIGLNDIKIDQIYLWADGTVMDHNLITWNQEPNDYKGQEDCAVIYGTGQYNDINCGIHAAAICELDNTQMCPPMWVSWGGNCYLFTAYNNVSVLFTQSEASNYCGRAATSSTSPGVVAKLLSVDDQNEKAFIRGKVLSMKDNVYGWYTSLNDKINEGTWVFGDAYISDPTLVDWQGEPSNATGDDCGMLNYGAVIHMRQCSNKLGYICEKKAVNSVGPVPIGKTTQTPPASGAPNVSPGMASGGSPQPGQGTTQGSNGSSATTSHQSIGLILSLLTFLHLFRRV